MPVVHACKRGGGSVVTEMDSTEGMKKGHKQ